MNKSKFYDVSLFIMFIVFLVVFIFLIHWLAIGALT